MRAVRYIWREIAWFGGIYIVEGIAHINALVHRAYHWFGWLFRYRWDTWCCICVRVGFASMDVFSLVMAWCVQCLWIGWCGIVVLASTFSVMVQHTSLDKLVRNSWIDLFGSECWFVLDVCCIVLLWHMWFNLYQVSRFLFSVGVLVPGCFGVICYHRISTLEVRIVCMCVMRSVR